MSKVMRLGDKSDWEAHMHTILESIDVDCFLDYCDEEWRDRFSMFEGGHAHYDRDRAFAFYTEVMTPAQFKTALAESGCRED